MIGLDSNVLVRYLAQDEPRQSARATQLIEHELDERTPGYISVVVLVETCGVLERLYGATPAELHATVRDLLDTRQFSVEHRAEVARALDRLSGRSTGIRTGTATNGDFADALIAELGISAGCTRVVTFDRKAAKLGMALLLR